MQRRHPDVNEFGDSVVKLPWKGWTADNFLEEIEPELEAQPNFVSADVNTKDEVITPSS